MARFKSRTDKIMAMIQDKDQSIPLLPDLPDLPFSSTNENLTLYQINYSTSDCNITNIPMYTEDNVLLADCAQEVDLEKSIQINEHNIPNKYNNTINYDVGVVQIFNNIPEDTIEYETYTYDQGNDDSLVYNQEEENNNPDYRPNLEPEGREFDENSGLQLNSSESRITQDQNNDALLQVNNQGEENNDPFYILDSEPQGPEIDKTSGLQLDSSHSTITQDQDNDDLQVNTQGIEDNDPDYIPDIEPENPEVDEDSNHSEENENVRRRNKRQFVDEEKWNENKKKQKREKGEEYFGKRKVDGKWKYDIKKEKKKLLPPCNCKLSQKSSTLRCRSFSELERTNIFTHFWSEMTWAERKLYISFLVKSRKISRSRNKVNETSRRTQSLVYYMKKGQDEVRVCKQMFLNTHNLKENLVLDWIKKQTNESTLINETKMNEEVKPDRYRNLKENLKLFFNELPKMESHYCRSSTTKLYLEPNWRSKSSLYTFYKQWCQEKSTPCVSIASFYHVFEELNLSLFQPKKDECDSCVAHRTGNLSQEAYELHQAKKREAREEKSKDKESENKVFCMDLQSVLLAPKSNTSSLYFKTKLIVHNFTIFDLKTKDGYCYLWHESAGGVSATDYATIIARFIETNVFPKLQPEQKIIYRYSHH